MASRPYFVYIAHPLFPESEFCNHLNIIPGPRASKSPLRTFRPAKGAPARYHLCSRTSLNARLRDFLLYKVLSANGDKPCIPTHAVAYPAVAYPAVAYLPPLCAHTRQKNLPCVSFRNRLESYLRNAFLQAASQRVSTAALSDKGSFLLLFVTAFVCVLS